VIELALRALIVPDWICSAGGLLTVGVGTVVVVETLFGFEADRMAAFAAASTCAWMQFRQLSVPGSFFFRQAAIADFADGANFRSHWASVP
jgi:hypothetical protein